MQANGVEINGRPLQVAFMAVPPPGRGGKCKGGKSKGPVAQPAVKRRKTPKDPKAGSDLIKLLGVPADAEKAEIVTFLRQFGVLGIADVDLVDLGEKGKGTGVAYVQFQTPENVKSALAKVPENETLRGKFKITLEVVPLSTPEPEDDAAAEDDAEQPQGEWDDAFDAGAAEADWSGDWRGGEGEDSWNGCKGKGASGTIKGKGSGCSFKGKPSWSPCGDDSWSSCGDDSWNSWSCGPGADSWHCAGKGGWGSGAGKDSWGGMAGKGSWYGSMDDSWGMSGKGWKGGFDDGWIGKGWKPAVPSARMWPY